MAEAVKEADVFIGVSAPGLLTKEMVQSMKEKPIVFAMANPEPEIKYHDAVNAGLCSRRNWTFRLPQPDQ